jgi:hypothetical protein
LWDVQNIALPWCVACRHLDQKRKFWQSEWHRGHNHMHFSAEEPTNEG